MKAILPLLTSLALLLTGCNGASPDSDAQFESLEVGMTVAEVEAILGQPTSKIEEISGHMMLWKMDDGTMIAITTDDAGKVTSTSRGRQ